MPSVLKGQSAGKSAQFLTLSTPSAADTSAVRALFDAHRQELTQATGVPRAMQGPDRMPLHVFPGDAVPSFRTAGRHLALADVAAMDAVEGRARFCRVQRARGA